MPNRQLLDAASAWPWKGSEPDRLLAREDSLRRASVSTPCCAQTPGISPALARDHIGDRRDPAYCAFVTNA